VLFCFTTVWTSWAGWPHVVMVDRGKEFMADFAQSLTDHGTELESIPLETPWQLGKAEKRGDLWKEIWRRVFQDCQMEGLEACRTTATLVTQVINETENVEGFSPIQWALDSHFQRIPGSLLMPSEQAMLEVQQAAADPTSAMARKLQIREERQSKSHQAGQRSASAHGTAEEVYADARTIPRGLLRVLQKVAGLAGREPRSDTQMTRSGPRHRTRSQHPKAVRRPVGSTRPWYPRSRRLVALPADKRARRKRAAEVRHRGRNVDALRDGRRLHRANEQPGPETVR